MSRIYLDFNATTPLRPEAKAAMIEAMEIFGNPSSVHQEGRAAKGLIERARRDIAQAFGAEGADIIFTSSASEAAALALAGQGILGSALEHDAVLTWTKSDLQLTENGQVTSETPENSTIQLANSETGIIQRLPDGLHLTDATQGFGKIPFSFAWSGAKMAIVSAHKLGGPKGVGALIVKRGTEISAQIRGGGQEMGRRSGTENIIGIAGFAAAAQAAQRDLTNGVFDRIGQFRKILENLIAESANMTILVGNGEERLPNTSCFITPGFKAETQVMLMDLAGFAISAGSACSSGKIKSSAALVAMGYAPEDAACAIRVSLGPTTTEAEIRAFARAWLLEYEKFQARRS